MAVKSISRLATAATLVLGLAACGGGSGLGSGPFSGQGSSVGSGPVTSGNPGRNQQRENNPNGFSRDFDSAARANAVKKGDSVFDLFQNNDDPNVTLRVNKYLWNASLDVLNFMPVQRADPFTGTISMGFGRAPGSSRAYRATVYITDPALDARALRVALQGAGGAAVSTETVRAIEDAILTRARQLRIRDTKL